MLLYKQFQQELCVDVLNLTLILFCGNSGESIK